MMPGGDLYPTLIRKNPIKPIRIFLQDGSNDLYNEHGNWFLANQQMLSAFEYANANADKRARRDPDTTCDTPGATARTRTRTAARCCRTSWSGSGSREE